MTTEAKTPRRSSQKQCHTYAMQDNQSRRQESEALAHAGMSMFKNNWSRAHPQPAPITSTSGTQLKMTGYIWHVHSAKSPAQRRHDTAPPPRTGTVHTCTAYLSLTRDEHNSRLPTPFSIAHLFTRSPDQLPREAWEARKRRRHAPIPPDGESPELAKQRKKRGWDLETMICQPGTCCCCL